MSLLLLYDSQGKLETDAPPRVNDSTPVRHLVASNVENLERVMSCIGSVLMNTTWLGLILIGVQEYS